MYRGATEESGSVLPSGRAAHRTTTGWRLASALLLLAPAVGQAADGPIQDNSFLIEEAYNQEPGVIQHISTFSRSPRTGAWVYSFTEEWPVLGQTHQASATFNYASLQGPNTSGLGDLLLNYRLQLVGDGEKPVAMAPRLSLVLPTGDAPRGLGSGGAGVQVNVPLSVVMSRDFVTHVNIGGTYIPSARVSSTETAPQATFALGQSLIWLAHQNLNFMLEVLYSSTEIAARAGTARTDSLFVNPGLRAAINFANGLQVVPGIAVPIGLGPSRGEIALFWYLSFEHPFRLAGPQAGHSEPATQPAQSEVRPAGQES